MVALLQLCTLNGRSDSNRANASASGASGASRDEEEGGATAMMSDWESEAGGGTTNRLGRLVPLLLLLSWWR